MMTKKQAIVPTIAAVLVTAVLCITAFSIPWVSAAMYGDLDRNGELTSGDVRIMMRYMVGEPLSAQQYAQADLDGNKRVNTADAKLVLSAIAYGQSLADLPTTTTTVVTTTTTLPSLDDEGYYDEIVKP